MLCLRAHPFIFSFTFSSSKHLLNLRHSLSFISTHPTSSSFSSVTMSSSSKQTIEHVVLLKVKDNTDQPKVKSMLNGLNGLITLDEVLHLNAGPVLRSHSSYLNFTHMLHSRYNSKEDLNGYSQHPSHVNVVKERVLPICDDVMAVDWIADDLQGSVVPPIGSAMRVTFLKLKESLDDGVKSEILEVIQGIKNSFGQIRQLTCGENFSTARSKGFSIASIAVFRSVSDMEVVDSYQELVDLQKEKVRDYLESVVVVDYEVLSLFKDMSRIYGRVKSILVMVVFYQFCLEINLTTYPSL